MGDGRITGKTSPSAQAAALLRRARQRSPEYQAKHAERERVNRKVKAMSEQEVKDRLTLTDKDFKILDEIIESPKRNAMAQLAALRMKALFTVTQPKQEIGGDIGIQVIVNTMKKLPPAEVIDGDGSVVEDLDPGGG